MADKKKVIRAEPMSEKEQREYDKGYQSRRSADKSFTVLNPYYLSDKIEDMTGSGSQMYKAGKKAYDEGVEIYQEGGKVGRSYRGYGKARCN
jgi:hypothetical protein